MRSRHDSSKNSQESPLKFGILMASLPKSPNWKSNQSKHGTIDDRSARRLQHLQAIVIRLIDNSLTSLQRLWQRLGMRTVLMRIVAGAIAGNPCQNSVELGQEQGDGTVRASPVPCARDR